MKTGVVVFPGSDEREVINALKEVTGNEPGTIWHKESSFQGYDAVIVPGGTSFGHYLRPGALAARSPVIEGLRIFAEGGGKIMGICNGFQILLEAGLLPGAILQNESLEYRVGWTGLRVVRKDTLFTGLFEDGEEIELPVAHNAGFYYAPSHVLKELQENNQIVLEYLSGQNPSGSLMDIAGIVNEKGNVFGLMPRPERAVEEALGGTFGKKMFLSLTGGIL